ncbi:MAG: hypothetical protein U0002_11210 [Thermoanaerobaculia bacterium]
MTTEPVALLPAPGSPALRRRQLRAVFRNELARSFGSRRAILLYLAAFAPIGLAIVVALVTMLEPEGQSPATASQTYAWIYQVFVLRLVLFFGNVWAFINLFRGEVLDRSLHFSFLTPARRELIVLGKFLAGVTGTSLLFGAATLVSYVVMFLPFGSAGLVDFVFAGPGLGQAAAYVGITALACVGYGSLALLLGLFFTNSVLPALVLFAWETIEFLLPGALKRVSVIHYLKSLAPLPLSDGPFAIVAEPSPAWVSIGGLLVLAAVLVTIACWRARRFEIRYGED